MSKGEWEQAKSAHRERRMTITSETCDIMSKGEWEQAKMSMCYTYEERMNYGNGGIDYV